MAQWTEDGFQDGRYPAAGEPTYRGDASYGDGQQGYSTSQQGHTAYYPAADGRRAPAAPNSPRQAYERRTDNVYSAPQTPVQQTPSGYPPAQQQAYAQQTGSPYSPRPSVRSPRSSGTYPQQRFNGTPEGYGPQMAPMSAYNTARAPRQGSLPRRPGTTRSLAFTVVAALIGVVVGFLITFLVMSIVLKAPVPVAPTLTESELGTVVGTYRFDGTTYEITARDAILGSTSLANRENGDGTFDTPTADMIMSYARNQILAQLVEDNGVTVTEEEVAAYALKTVGTSDMASVAQYVGMDEEQARQALTEAAAVGKLRESVVGAPDAGAPTPPTLPSDGNTEVGTAQYADYIIALLGPHWDAAAGTWSNTDNPYYAALADKVFAPGSANYEAAQAAYNVAFEQYQAGSGTAASWTDYVNGYLDKAAISVATLRA